jgi:hypothetical protein
LVTGREVAASDSGRMSEFSIWNVSGSVADRSRLPGLADAPPGD